MAYTPNAQKFLAQKPTLIVTVGGNKFYEHPVLGDEAPLICITHDGRKKKTDFWDADAAHEDFADKLNITQ
tara:strand:- start:600 stop:812 length:213 start_codon:yes stop_codon:yes gene_type:complete